MGHTVNWSIDIEGGSTLEDGSPVDSPEAAALYAYEAFTRNHSIAHVFEVTDEETVTHRVDLDETGALEWHKPAVLATGNPFDGINLIGPFRNVETANEYADEQHIGGSDDWWALGLELPRD